MKYFCILVLSIDSFRLVKLFQAVFGGPFLPHIEQILCDKASLMSSRVISASEAGRGSKIKGFSLLDGRPYQSCDIVIAQDTEPKQVQLIYVLFLLYFTCVEFIDQVHTAIQVVRCETTHAWKPSASKCSHRHLHGTVPPCLR